MPTSPAWPGSAKFSDALDAAAIVAITDRAGVITYCNQRFCDVSGFSREALLGSNHRIVNSGYHPRSFFKDLYKTISRGEVWRGTIRNRRKDGALYWVDTTIVPNLDAEGRPASYTSIRFDVTAHVQALEDLAEARRLAEEAVLAKDRFIANMSHEVRTPLNGVIGIAAALENTELRSRQRDMVELILSSGQSLRRTLDEILDLSKMQAGCMPLEIAPFRPRETITAAAELMRPAAHEKGLALSIEFNGEVSDAFLGDEMRIRQIVSNLAANAIKFTERGGVAIRASVDGPADTKLLRIEVEDSGIGFDAEASAVFKPFAQADESIARRYGGTGLGLSICKSLAELMGGAISARSVRGAGSLFKVDIPLRRSELDREQRTRARSPAFTAGALHVLLVEDHPTNQKVVEYLLEPFGVVLTIAPDGAEALRHFTAARFDAVLMDMQMPVMDGLTAISLIRAMEEREGLRRTPIAMMTANTSDEHHRKALAVGADTLIDKPVTLETLTEGLDQLLTLSASWSNNAPSASDTMQQPLRAAAR